MSKQQTTGSEMTREEFQRLRDELEHLKTVERNDVSEKIRVARGYGDLSENSEYDEAKNDQARLEARISRLEEQLKNVVIVEHVDTDSVTVGTRVRLLDMEMDEECEYRISSGASGSGGELEIITSDSPVGRAILGKKVGDVVLINPPSGKPYEMKVLGIDK